MQAILTGPAAGAAHDGDRHRQDRRRVPDLLEALDRRAGTARASTASREILYLADRNILVDDPKDKIFAPFGDARYKIEDGETQSRAARCISRSTRPSPRTSAGPGLYREYPPDFFDLIIVDECHRGSARDESNWREILEYFEPAYQLGMTATPLREDNRDTYLYFGNPLYTYSLRQGIEDGFLAPYRVHRVVTTWDAAGWRPSKGELDRYGREIPDEEYQTKDFERVVALRARTEAIARHLTEFLKKTDRFAKTIVFCVDQEHADEMRRALDNLNADLVAAASGLRLPRDRRRGRHRARPPQPLPGRGDADARRSSPPRSCSPPASMRPPARTSCWRAWSAR